MRSVILFTAMLIGALSVQAGTFNMVQINPGAGYCDNIFTDSAKYVYGAGDLKHYARMNGLLYFVGNDAAYNDELWVTDGTQQGTHKIKDINPNGGSHIGDLKVVGTKIFFIANETTSDLMPTDDYDLFVTDGTTAGTTKVKDLDQPFNNLLAEQNAGVTNGKIVFCTQTDVMVTDGSSAGTKSLAALNIVSYTGANGYCEMNGSVYFIVNSDIWKSDGTVAGTKAVKALADSSTNWSLAFASFIKAFDGRLYVIGAKSGEGDDLYTFDGTSEGAVTKVVSAPTGNCYPGNMNICGGALWFAAYDTVSYALYRLSASGAAPQSFGAMNGALSFGSNKVYYPNNDNNGYEVIDALTGARSGFSRSSLPLNGFGFNVNANSVLTMGDKVIYLAYDSASGQQVMCITDGTSAGIKVAMPAGVAVAHPFDYVAGCGVIDVFDITYYGSKLVVPANFNNAGRELWFFEESDLVSGIDEQKTNSLITMYPNPANDVVTIDLGKDQTAAADLSVQIMDMAGRVAFTSDVKGNKLQVAASAIASGSYVVAVNKGTETIARQKLVIAH